MRETLPIALKLTFGDEGGYSDVKTDAGGPTKYGITWRTLAADRGIHPPEKAKPLVKSLTLADAENIYRKGYWTQAGGDLLPKGLDYQVFDAGVMSGPARAVRILQRLVGVVEDGNVGPQTLAAVKDYPKGQRQLMLDYADAFMAFLRGLKSSNTGFPVNGRGWTIRVTGIDPKGVWARKPGVIGNALEIAFGITASTDPLPSSSPAPEGGDAKAVPPEPNPWTKPEVLLPGIGGLLSPSLLTGMGPVQIAIGVAIVIAIGIGAFYAIRRIQRMPA